MGGFVKQAFDSAVFQFEFIICAFWCCFVQLNQHRIVNVTSKCTLSTSRYAWGPLTPL